LIICHIYSLSEYIKLDNFTQEEVMDYGEKEF
jgi:hypothetical protein